MRNYYFTDAEGLTWARVTRKTARRLHLEGRTVRACPCNLRPDSMWAPAFHLEPAEDFERFEASATWHNCTNAETGRYLAWYAPAVIRPRIYRECLRGRRGKQPGTFYNLEALEPAAAEAAEAAGAHVCTWRYRWAPELNGPALFVPDTAVTC